MLIMHTDKPNIFDVFLGKGWGFWGRFVYKHNTLNSKPLIQIKGSKFTREELEEVEIKLCHM